VASSPLTNRFAPGMKITRAHFRDVDGLVEDLRFNQRMFARGENLLVRMLAMTHVSLAQQKSRGPVVQGQRRYNAPRGKAHIFGTKSGFQGPKPWGIPVRRITGAYYEGWKMKRIGPSQYMVFNDSREAYFIEFGINPRATGAVRRPIMKMTAIGTMRFIQRTHLIERFAEATIGGTRNKKGQYQSFMARMQGSNMLGVIGPKGKLPG
jgi:hypothetical protein